MNYFKFEFIASEFIMLCSKKKLIMISNFQKFNQLINISQPYQNQQFQMDHHNQLQNLQSSYSEPPNNPHQYQNQSQNNYQLMSQEKMQEEQLKHRLEVKTAFLNYAKDMKQTYSDLFNQQKIQKYWSLARQRKKQEMERAIACNQDFLNKIVEYINSEELTEQIQQNTFEPLQVTACHNISKIRTTVKQFYRQWCSQSSEAANYQLITEKVEKYLQKGQKIVVPGCGLGRLVLELVKAGYGAQGNQVTYFMLYGSNFILNCCTNKEEFEIYPFIHSYGNMRSQQDIFRTVKVPDLVASEVVDENADFSMAAGQFTQIYKNQTNKFDGVVTCFFLDTANNIFLYVDTIHEILTDNGIWINYGPLLYHYKDMLDQVSVEISYENLQKYILSKGFVKQQQQFRKTTYCHDNHSLYAHQYNILLSVWKKEQ